MRQPPPRDARSRLSGHVITATFATLVVRPTKQRTENSKEASLISLDAEHGTVADVLRDCSARRLNSVARKCVKQDMSWSCSG